MTIFNVMSNHKLPKVTDVETWQGWSGDSPKNLRIWRDTGTEYKPIMANIAKIKYVYHGTSLNSALKLLQTGIKKTQEGGDGLNVTTDLGYAMSFSIIAVDDNPKNVVAIVAIPTKLINWKQATMSDNADDEQNAQIFNAIPGSNLKIVAIGTSSSNLQKAQAKLREQTDRSILSKVLSYLLS